MPREDASDHIFQIASQFIPLGQVVSASPFGSGHINDTYEVSYTNSMGTWNLVLQRINTDIFPDPDGVMNNIQKVCGHVHRKLLEGDVSEKNRRCLSVVPTQTGALWYQDKQGGAWRAYPMIEGCYSIDRVSSPSEARELGKAFGNFLFQLSDFEVGKLSETIPNFHHTPSRFQVFLEALRGNRANRAKSCQAETAYALRFEDEVARIANMLADGSLPTRVTHNDTKINNILFCERSHEGVCVIDLDTCMPGSALYDFGDMVRSAVSFSDEDEQDIARVRLEKQLFQALLEGYLEKCGDILHPLERENLIRGAKTIILEQAIRFLGDYLNGDTYYKVKYPEHNLVRARTQLKLLQDLEEQEESLSDLIK